MAALILAEVPALPLNTAGRYVAAAYIVLFVIVVIYVAIIGLRLSRLERDLGEMLELPERPPQHAETEQPAHTESTPA